MELGNYYVAVILSRHGKFIDITDITIYRELVIERWLKTQNTKFAILHFNRWLTRLNNHGGGFFRNKEEPTAFPFLAEEVDGLLP